MVNQYEKPNNRNRWVPIQILIIHPLQISTSSNPFILQEATYYLEIHMIGYKDVRLFTHLFFLFTRLKLKTHLKVTNTESLEAIHVQRRWEG